MIDLMKPKGIDNDCLETPTYKDYIANGTPVGCGAGNLPILYFFSFSIIVPLIFLNLFVAIILEGFEETNKKEN